MWDPRVVGVIHAICRSRWLPRLLDPTGIEPHSERLILRAEGEKTRGMYLSWAA
jgi:hypothetical protein